MYKCYILFVNKNVIYIIIKLFCIGPVTGPRSFTLAREPNTVKPVLSSDLKIDKTKAWKPFGVLMQVKSILQYFWPALSDYLSWKPIFPPSFEWPLKTGFTVADQGPVIGPIWNHLINNIIVKTGQVFNTCYLDSLYIPNWLFIWLRLLCT